MILARDIKRSIERHLKEEITSLAIAWAGTDFNTENIDTWIEPRWVSRIRNITDPGIERANLLYQVSGYTKTGDGQNTTDEIRNIEDTLESALARIDSIPIRATTNGTITGYLVSTVFDSREIPSDISTVQRVVCTWGAVVASP